MGIACTVARSVCVYTCTLQSDGVEESTGIVYPHREEDGGVQSGVSEGRDVQDLVKSGYTQIHVSYDRIEPETGESENVAVDVDGGSRGGGGGGERGTDEEQMEEGEVVSSEECGGGPGTPVQDEALTASAGGNPDSTKRYMYIHHVYSLGCITW